MVDVKKIEEILHDHFRIYHKYTIDSKTGVVDIQGDIIVKKRMLPQTQLPVQFGTVSEDFICHDVGMHTLKGAPIKVGGDFVCSGNQLTNLTHAPLHVGGDFHCADNKLISLSGSPLEVGGDFSCQNNHLTSLRGASDQINGSFRCDSNPLTTLEGAPTHVGKYFTISYNENLPLLKLCNYKKIIIEKSPTIINKIMKKYTGQGKPGALKAAAELVRAGYMENARW